MICDDDHDHWPIEVEQNGFSKIIRSPKEKPSSFHFS